MFLHNKKRIKKENQKNKKKKLNNKNYLLLNIKITKYRQILHATQIDF